MEDSVLEKGDVVTLSLWGGDRGRTVQGIVDFIEPSSDDASILMLGLVGDDAHMYYVSEVVYFRKPCRECGATAGAFRLNEDGSTVCLAHLPNVAGRRRSRHESKGEAQ